MSKFRKFAKKSAKKAVRFVRKRYATKTGGVRVAKIAQDVMKIQRMLNVEHKHFDIQIGRSMAAYSPALTPTRNKPIILALPTPIRGTNFNQRVGNQIRIVHMTAKWEFTFTNNSDFSQRSNVRARIIFAKNPSDVPDIAQLMEVDANGHYTPNSFVNTQEYKKFSWIKSLDASKGYTDPERRYTTPNYNATLANQLGVDTPNQVSLHHAIFYLNKMAKTSIKVMFENLSEEVAQMKPYLFLTSDVKDKTLIIGTPTYDYDPVYVSANIRMTYVDN